MNVLAFFRGAQLLFAASNTAHIFLLHFHLPPPCLLSSSLPPRQVSAVQAWAATKGARPASFNMSHRACPDLSIYDAGFYIVQDGSDSVIGGTSAATPTLAGMEEGEGKVYRWPLTKTATI